MKTATLFKTKQEIDQALASFTNSEGNQLWVMVCKILDANIADVTYQILHPPAETPEKELHRLRSNLAIMEEIRNTPKNMIEKLSASEDQGTEAVDPDNVYETDPDRKDEKVQGS